jgi:hypothetical protein
MKVQRTDSVCRELLFFVFFEVQRNSLPRFFGDTVDLRSNLIDYQQLRFSFNP